MKICSATVQMILFLLLGLTACGQATMTATPPSTLFVTPTVTIELPTPTATPDKSFENGLPLVARVNNQPIFLYSYERQVTQFTRTLPMQNIDWNGTAGQETLKQTRQQLLDNLINQVIIEQQADKLAITVTTATLESKIEENVAQNQVQLESWLANNHLTDKEFKESLRIQLIANQLFEQVTHDVLTTTEQVGQENEPSLTAVRSMTKREFFTQWFQKQRAATLIELYRQ